MNIERGWKFHTADFSLQAAGKSKLGQVKLVRDLENRRKWHLQDEETIESDDCPPLYAKGSGDTIENAIVSANMAAAHAEAIST